ncbi:cell division protein FtsQ/DivIB [Denitrificimonas sp. JX-1]|uniref:Cell division protein FtsQ n=1 Tax=Denitrificimonas halotolerans TaxID=3098930 RepID=A0ABU5GVD0_9GAMM|nr:cell division protein FtsQ/DivIB [Denitrificimonas sp. JX-1]MDY7220246.1 cell division protein FtsQ/DivIB [Denitrificimonas sp. JX-1]
MGKAPRVKKTAAKRGATRQTQPRRAVARQLPEPNWKLIGFVALCGILLGVVLHFERGWQALRPHIDPQITTVRVLGDLTVANRRIIEQQSMPYTAGTFFTVDIAAVRNAIDELPWVANAEVSRVWPSQLQIIIQEQLPVARWGNDALLSTQGYLFTAVDVDAYSHLPQLYGPKDTQLRVMQQYLAFSQALRPLGYSVKELEMRERGSWFVTTQTGLKLLFGRDHLVEKIRRFAVVYEKELQGLTDKIERVDLRYANGLAVAWRTPSESETTAVVAQ